MKPRYRAKTINGEHVVFDFLARKTMTVPFPTRAQAARFAKKMYAPLQASLHEIPTPKRKPLHGGAHSNSLVKHFTGHDEYQQRQLEVKFILAQFKRYRCKFKGATAEFLDSINLNRLTPNVMFRLRDIYQRRRKIMNTESV